MALQDIVRRGGVQRGWDAVLRGVEGAKEGRLNADDCEVKSGRRNKAKDDEE